MIIGIDMGHTISGANYGAVGILKESEQTRILGNKVIDYLKQLGHTVINCTIDKAASNTYSLNKRVTKANSQKLDLFVSLHFNASNGQGHGTEIFTYGAKEIVQARGVLNNISALGFTNRGIKDGSHLAVIKGTRWPAMLVEICFIDNKKDINLYNSNIDKIAASIAEGITGNTLSSTSISSNKDNPIAPYMQKEIKIIQGTYGFKQDGIATDELINKLPDLKGYEQRGIVTVMQRILILKGFLSSKSATGVIGPANKNAINKFKESVGIPIDTILIDRQTWRKLLEY